MLPPIKVLEKHVCGAGESSVTFANIDTLVAAWDAKAGVTSRHLVLLVNGRVSKATNTANLVLQFNGDTGANYNRQYLSGVSGTPGATRTDGSTSVLWGVVPADNYPNASGGGYAYIPNAFGTSTHKSVLGVCGGSEVAVYNSLGRWASTAAITNLTVFSFDDFITGSTFILAVVDERFCIEEQILDGSDGTFTFADIPQGDGDLFVIGSLRGARANVEDWAYIEINDDSTAANYARQYVRGKDAAKAASSASDDLLAYIPGANATANVFAPFAMQISQYAKEVNDPHYLVLAGYHETSTPLGYVSAFSGRRNNIEAITKLKIKGAASDFKDGSMMSLYYSPTNRQLIKRVECYEGQPAITYDDLDKYSPDFEAIVVNNYLRSNEAAVGDEAKITLNDDTTAANYDTQNITGTGAAAAAARSAASQLAIYIPGDSEGANEFGGGTITIPNYAGSVFHKHLIEISGQQENNIALQSQRFESTAAITKIAIAPVGGTGFKQGSFSELWGIIPADTVIRKRGKTSSQTLGPRQRVWRD